MYIQFPIGPSCLLFSGFTKKQKIFMIQTNIETKIYDPELRASLNKK